MAATTTAATSSTSPDNDIPVLLEDQERINRFSCLNVRLKEYEAMLADLDVSRPRTLHFLGRQEEIRQLDDAIDEVSMCINSDTLM